MSEEQRVTGTSFESFSEAAANAFADIPGDASSEGLASARVERMWLEKGGIVGRTQYRVELVAPAEGRDRYGTEGQEDAS